MELGAGAVICGGGHALLEGIESDAGLSMRLPADINLRFMGSCVRVAAGRGGGSIGANMFVCGPSNSLPLGCVVYYNVDKVMLWCRKVEVVSRNWLHFIVVQRTGGGTRIVTAMVWTPGNIGAARQAPGIGWSGSLSAAATTKVQRGRVAARVVSVHG